MKNSTTFLTIAFGILALLGWLLPDIKIEYKIAITCLVFLSIVIIQLKDKLFYFIQKKWQEIVSILILITGLTIINQQFTDLFSPHS